MGPTPAQNKAQIAMAMADADCIQATDRHLLRRPGQQVVNANQQAHNTAVREYKANYAMELSELPAAADNIGPPALPHGPGRPGGPAHAGTPSPTHS